MEDRAPGDAPSAPPAAAIVKALTWTGATHAVGQLCWFGSLVALGALLPPRAFGTVAAATAVVTVATVLMGQGTRGAIISSEEVTRQMVVASIVRTLVPATLAAAAMAVLAGPIVRSFAEGGSVAPVRVMAIGILFHGAAIVPLALLQKRLRFERKATITGTAAGLAGALSIVAALVGAGVWALVVRLIVYSGSQAVMGWWSVRSLVPPRAAPDRPFRRHRDARAFLVLSLADFVALTCDNLVVGRSTDASRLGLYSLAFTLAFAPLTQFSWQLGSVLFPVAAATSDLATVARRTLRATRLTSLVLLPLLIPAAVAAPAVVPAVLGDEWRPMITPFQILLVTGVGHALVNVIGESLSGTGGVPFRAAVHAVWAVLTLITVAVLVNLYGIRGAAAAHLLLFIPLAIAYAVRGTQLLGTSAAALWREIRPVALAVVVQAIAAGAVGIGASAAGASYIAAQLAAAGAAVVAAALALGVGVDAPLRDARRSLRTGTSTQDGASG